MRILFAGIPSYGHAFPPIPLVQAARDAGHDVRFATNAEFRPVLHGHGFGRIAVDAFPSRSQPSELGAEHGMTVDDPERGTVVDVCPESLQDKEFLAGGPVRVWR